MKISIGLFALMTAAILLFSPDEIIYSVEVIQHSGQKDTLLLNEDQWIKRKFNEDYFTSPEEWADPKKTIPLERVESYRIIDTATY